MELNSFYYALSLLKTLFEITMNEDEFEEIALIGWEYIGNKTVKLHRFKACLSECKNYVELPCNCDIIEAVTNGSEDWNYVTNDSINGDPNSLSTEMYIELGKSSKHPLYIPGQFIDYEKVGNKLYFNEPLNVVNILYKGVVLDENGLPKITDREAVAIATYCAYVSKYKEGLRTNNSNALTIANDLKMLWYLRADLARIDYNMSQNEWDQVLDAKTSWNRKQYHKSIKLVQ